MLSERMKSLTPYTPGEQPRGREYIKLNTNENAYGPTPEIRKVLNNLDIDGLRRYPDPLSLELRRSLAEEKGVKEDNVFFGNGSDEVLAFSFYAFFDGLRGDLLFPGHTYSFYPVYAGFYSIPYTRIPLKADFSIDLDDYLAPRSCGVIFPNPNAPTGMALPLASIRRFLDACPADRVVIVDEAYIDFGAESAVPLIDEYPNLLVVGTLSKGRSLAGLRLGYALGQESLIQALSTVKDSFNSYPVDILAQQLGLVALNEKEYYNRVNGRIIANREWFTAALKERGWLTLPSKANFIFTRKPGISGAEIYSKLKENGFLVRYFDHEGIKDFVRITIGTDEDMKALQNLMERLF